MKEVTMAALANMMMTKMIQTQMTALCHISSTAVCHLMQLKGMTGILGNIEELGEFKGKLMNDPNDDNGTALL